MAALSLEVPAEFALQGFEAVRALVVDPARSEALLSQVLGFSERATDDWEARGAERGGRILFEQSRERGIPGAGTVHHVAWSVLNSEIEEWQRHVTAAGAHAGKSAPMSVSDPRGTRSAATNPLIAVLEDAMRFYFEFHFDQGEGYLAHLHDPLAAAVALDPDLVSIREN